MYPHGYVPPFINHAMPDSPRTAQEAVNGCMAQRENVQSRLRREAVTSRDHALRLMQRAEKLERTANFLDSQPSQIEEMIHEIANV